MQSLASRRAATELKKSIRFIALPFVDTVGLIKQPLDFFFRKRARKVRDFQELVQAVVLSIKVLQQVLVLILVSEEVSVLF